MKDAKDAKRTRNESISAVFKPQNPKMLVGGAKDADAVWLCTVTHRDTKKKLAPSRVATVDFPPADRRLIYSTPADHEVMDTGLAGWRFRYRANSGSDGAPRTRMVRLKVWVDELGWNYSDTWSFEEKGG